MNDSSVEGPPGVPKTLYTGSSYQAFTVKATNVGNLTTAKVRAAAILACSHEKSLCNHMCRLLFAFLLQPDDHAGDVASADSMLHLPPQRSPPLSPPPPDVRPPSPSAP